VTYLERPNSRINLTPALIALALACAFALGVLIGGPVLQLSIPRPETSLSISQATRDGGHAWELQRLQQGARTGSLDATTNADVMAGGRAWEAQRRVQAP
jgi:hypothetical protein